MGAAPWGLDPLIMGLCGSFVCPSVAKIKKKDFLNHCAVIIEDVLNIKERATLASLNML